MSSFRTMCLALVLGGCATAPSPQTTSTAPTYRPRPGSIESIAEVEDHIPSNTVDDALVGILIGGLLFADLLFDHGPWIVTGAENGTWPSTPSDGEPSSVPRYRVVIRFDDGGSMNLEYRGDVPFERGERVVLTLHGLVGA